MGSDVKRRVQQLEARTGDDSVEIWLSWPDDDIVTGPGGQVLEREEFEARYPDAKQVKMTWTEADA